MKPELQKLTIPDNYSVLKNDFSTYDPENDYSEDKNLFYLSEDLLQIEIEHLNIVIDLGWYGELFSNQGSFKIFVVKNNDWENPIITEISKSQRVIKDKLENILLFFK